MRGVRLGGLAVVAACLGLWGACHQNTPVPGTDSDADADVEADADDETGPGTDADQDDSDGPPGDADSSQTGGPLTAVINNIALTEERLCDLDDDGDLDNAIADLGVPNSTYCAMAMNTLIQGALNQGFRLVLHSPWVDDPAGPTDESAVMIVFEGKDSDDPPVPEDDFSGDEAFYVAGNSLDGCGEPLFYFSDLTIAEGEFSADSGSLPLPLGGDHALETERAQLWGSVEPYGVSSTVVVCACATIHTLGDEPGLEEAGDLTMLEVLLAGGEPFGLPFPGINPDVDIDHDGTESFLTDSVGHITACVDGDRTTIEGRDCYADPRMADAFSLTLDATTVGASCAGRVSGWFADTDGVCDEPPDESLFDSR